MKPKTIVTGLLLAFVAASIAWLVVREIQARNEGGEAASKESPSGVLLTVYYFHATARCLTCNRIEKLTREAVQTGFAEDLQAGRIEVRTLNREEPANKSFVEKYRLATNAVVLVRREAGKPGRWKDLKRIWDLVPDDAAFGKYVQGEIRALLERN